MKTRAVRWLAGAAAGLSLAAGCGGADPMLNPATPDEVAHAVVTVRQAGTILEQIQAARAASKGDPAAAGGRVGPVYASIMKAELAQAKVAKKSVPAPVPLEGERLLLSQRPGWPRFFVLVGNRSGVATPVIQVMQSASAREPYQLWGELEMLPGATLPEMERATLGAPVSAADSDEALLSPEAAFTKYADVLTQGPDSDEATTFSADTFTNQVVARQRDDAKGLAEVASMAVKHQVMPGSVFALRTKDNGILAFGVLEQKVTVKVKDGSVALTDQTVAALLNRAKITTSLETTAAELVAVVIPPKDGRQVSVIAAQKQFIAATGR